MEGICRLGGATCTWAAAGCPAIALGATGSKRDPADTTGSGLCNRLVQRACLAPGGLRHWQAVQHVLIFTSVLYK